MANPNGVRFWHKFDPVPSIALLLGQYQHEAEHTYTVYDVRLYPKGCMSGYNQPRPHWV